MTSIQKTDKERIGEILTQTIVSLCNSGLRFSSELSVEGLLGITLDKAEVFLVNIKEVVSSCQLHEESDFASVSPPEYESPSKHGVKRKQSEPEDSPVHIPRFDSNGSIFPSHPGRTQAFLTPGIHPLQKPTQLPPRETDLSEVKHEQSRAVCGQSLSRQLGISNELTHMTVTDKPPQYVSSSPEILTSQLHLGDRDNAQGLTVPKEEPEYSEADYGVLPVLDAGSHELTDLSSSGHDLFPTETNSMQQVQPQDMSTTLDCTSQVSEPSSIEEGTANINSYTQRHYNDNTMKCTLSNVRIVRRWLAEQKAENREVQDVPVQLLNEYLKEMWMSIRKQNGAEYGGSTLKYLKIHLNLYLMAQTNGRISLNTKDFATSNIMWERKWKALTAAEALRKPIKPPSSREPQKKARKMSRERASGLQDFRSLLKDSSQGNLDLLATQAEELQTSGGTTGSLYQPATYTHDLKSPLPPVHELTRGSLHRTDSESSVHDQLPRLALMPELGSDQRSPHKSPLPPVHEIAHLRQSDTSSLPGTPLVTTTRHSPLALVSKLVHRSPKDHVMMLPSVRELAQAHLSQQAHNNSEFSDKHRSPLPSVHQLTQSFLCQQANSSVQEHRSQLPPVSEIVTRSLSAPNPQSVQPAASFRNSS